MGNQEPQQGNLIDNSITEKDLALDPSSRT